MSLTMCLEHDDSGDYTRLCVLKQGDFPAFEQADAVDYLIFVKGNLLAELLTYGPPDDCEYEIVFPLFPGRGNCPSARGIKSRGTIGGSPTSFPESSEPGRSKGQSISLTCAIPP